MTFMNSILGGLVDKEKITHDTIQSTLENIAEEYNLPFSHFQIMIKPINEKFEMKFFIYKTELNLPPVFLREITLKEILGIEEDAE